MWLKVTSNHIDKTASKHQYFITIDSLDLKSLKTNSHYWEVEWGHGFQNWAHSVFYLGEVLSDLVTSSLNQSFIVTKNVAQKDWSQLLIKLKQKNSYEEYDSIQNGRGKILLKKCLSVMFVMGVSSGGTFKTRLFLQN